MKTLTRCAWPQIAAENNYTPVVATIATDDKGQALNINADTAAGEVGMKTGIECFDQVLDCVQGTLENKPFFSRHWAISVHTSPLLRYVAHLFESLKSCSRRSGTASYLR